MTTSPTGGVAPGATPWRLPRWLAFVALPFITALAISMAMTAYQQRSSPVGASRPPSRLEQLMGLSAVPHRSAPGFVLTDQRGGVVSLAHFKGRAVLLSFMDSRCTEVCPVIAQEFVLADRDLGPAASHVAFIAVNVNPKANSVADVSHFSQLHGLSKLANWYFLTGSPASLERVWKAYGIAVIVPKHASQTVHADYLYFLSASGKERYLADPQINRRPDGTWFLPPDVIAKWGQGIATYLEKGIRR
ncbi:MAG: SCO family protein [Acidimicrobiales bacterium]